MPLTLYAGPPRMGKTFEVVNHVMVPAYRAGRHIVTNIRGIDPDYWAATLSPSRKGEQLGTITVVDDEFLASEAVYPAYSKNAVIQPGAIPSGSLVIIDEAYAVFGTEKGMVTGRMLKWVMTHGQFTDDEGNCTDIVMVAQDLMLLAPKIRSVAESVYWVRNLRFIHAGLKKRYRVTGYPSWRMTGQPLGRVQKSYSDDGFKLYKSTSHATGKGNLVQTYKGSTAFSPMLIGALILSVLAALYGGWNTYQFLWGTPAVAAAVPGQAQKPDCNRSGVLLDIDARKALVNGEWRNATIAPVSLDGRVGWDVGSCVFRFGGRSNRG